MHQSVIGGLTSISLEILIFILFISAFQRVLTMDQPQVYSYFRFISLAEREDLGRLNLDNEGVFFAFNTPRVSVYNSTSSTAMQYNHSALPAELGRITAY